MVFIIMSWIYCCELGRSRKSGLAWACVIQSSTKNSFALASMASDRGWRSVVFLQLKSKVLTSSKLNIFQKSHPCSKNYRLSRQISSSSDLVSIFVSIRQQKYFKSYVKIIIIQFNSPRVGRDSWVLFNLKFDHYIRSIIFENSFLKNGILDSWS